MKAFVAISTVTWIRTKEEREIVLGTLEALSKLKVPIIVVDKSSPDNKKQIRNLNNIILFELVR